MKKSVFIFSGLAVFSLLATTNVNAKTIDGYYNIAQCSLKEAGLSADGMIDDYPPLSYNLCTKENVKRFDSIAKTKSVNFNRDYIFTEYEVKTSKSSAYVFYIAINPKTKTVFLNPYTFSKEIAPTAKELFNFSKTKNTVCVNNDFADILSGPYIECNPLTKKGFKFDWQ